METINNSNAKERAKLISIKKKLLKERKQCELCGSREKLCVHHILPLALGGTNDIDNLQVLCYNCHNYSDDIKAIHKKAKSVGSKRASEYKEVLISKTEFYYILYKKLKNKMNWSMSMIFLIL